MRGHVIGRGYRRRMRIRYGEGEAHGAHHGDIGRVIADTGTLPRHDAEALANALDDAALVRDALVEAADAELRAASLHSSRSAAGKDHDLDAGREGLPDSMAVTHVKNLQLLAARTEPEPAIREHAVDVQHQEANPRFRTRATPAALPRALHGLDCARRRPRAAGRER